MYFKSLILILDFKYFLHFSLSLSYGCDFIFLTLDFWIYLKFS